MQNRIYVTRQIPEIAITMLQEKGYEVTVGKEKNPLSQKDIVEQREHYDAVAHGGWAMDLHPADGIYSKYSSCTQWHSKGVYTIPYRCYYSKDIKNLFMAGRIISATHVAFGSSRVMLTCALGAQAVGIAAALCIKNHLNPKDIAESQTINILQLELNRNGQSIPGIFIEDDLDVAKKATVKTSSTLFFDGFGPGEDWQTLTYSTAQLLPLASKEKYLFYFEVEASVDTTLEIQFRTSIKNTHFTPDHIIHSERFEIKKGKHKIPFSCATAEDKNKYFYLCLMKNENLKVRLSDERCTGIMSVQNRINKAVSNYGKQEPPEGIAIDNFEFWTPERRPGGKNLAFSIQPALNLFDSANVTNGKVRPNSKGTTNAWVASKNEESASLTMAWDKQVSISTIKIFFDCDYDHALESTLMGHPEDTIPFTISDYMIEDDQGYLLAKVEGNYQAINTIRLKDDLKQIFYILLFFRKIKIYPYRFLIFQYFSFH